MKKILNYYRPGLGESWLIMIGILLLAGSVFTAVAAFVLNYIFPETLSLSNPNGWAIPILYILPFIAVFLFVWLRAKNKSKAALHGGIPAYPNPPAQIGQVPLVLFILLLPVLTISMSVIIDPLTEWLEMPEFIKEMFGKITQTNIPTFVAVVIAAPLLEEWLIREVALKGMLQHMAPHKAILWSSVMFGVIHMNPWQAIPAFLMGCLFGWIYYRTRSYWTCVALHALNNGMSFFLVAVLPASIVEESLRNLVGNQTFFVALGLSLAALALSIFYLHKHLAPAPSLRMHYEHNSTVSTDL